MAVTYFKMNYVGEAGPINLGRLVSTDAIATVLAAGYLDSAANNLGQAVTANDFIFVIASDAKRLCTATITNGSIDLVQLA